MPDNQAMIQVLYQVAGAENLKAANAALGNAETLNKKNTAAVKDTGNALGMTRREWMRTGSEASFYLTSIAQKSGEAGKALAGATAMATQLGESFMFSGAMGVLLAGAGLAAGALATALMTADPAADALDAKIKSLKTSSNDAATGLSNLTGMTREQAIVALEMASSNSKLRDELITLTTKTDAMSTSWEGFTQKLRDGKQPLADSFYYLQIMALYSTEWLVTLGDAEKAAAKVNEVTSKLALEKQTTEAATRSLTNSIINESAASKEQARVLGLLKTALPQARAEMESYTASVAKMKNEHTKAVAGFGADLLKAEADANERRAQHASDTAERIAGIESDLSKRIVDLQYDRNKQVEQNSRQRAKTENAANLEIQDAYRNMVRDLNAADYEMGQNINAAKTEREKEGARLAGEIKRREIRLSAQERMADMDRQRAERREDMAIEKREADERFARQLQQAREAAQAQIDATNSAAQKQREQIEATLLKSKTAIEDRKAAENTAYNENLVTAEAAHSAKMKQFKDIRDETTKLAEDLTWLTAHGWDIDVTLRSKLMQDFGANPFSGSFGGNQGGYGGVSSFDPQVSRFANGGSFTVGGVGGVDRNLVAFRASRGERVDITPSGAARAGNTFHIYGVTDPQGVAREVQRILDREANR